MAFSETGLDFGLDKEILNLIIKNEGTSTLNWSVTEPDESWIKLKKLKGISTKEVPDRLSLEVRREGLKPQAHQLDLAFISNGGNYKFPITINVKSKPALFVSSDQLDFGLDKKVLIISIENRGTGQLDWSMTIPEGWGTADQTSGQIRQKLDFINIKLVANREERALGDYQQKLTIVSNGGKMDMGVSIKILEKPQIGVSR